MLFRMFSRITSTGRFIPELDGLRAIAIFTVFVQHLHQALVSESSSLMKASPLVAFFIRDATIGVELFLS